LHTAVWVDLHIRYAGSSLFKKQPAPGGPADNRIDAVSKQRPVPAIAKGEDTKPNGSSARTATSVAYTDYAVRSRPARDELRA
jgi:hypothetical protein